MMTLLADEYKSYTIKGHPGVYVFMDDGDGQGPLTTQEDFDTFVPGYAHVFGDGTIKRYGRTIGTKNDLVEVVEAKLNELDTTKEVK